ncbi:MAG TPA: SRPBCC domain-containing protein [Thermoanaerobaculia bacterium]
MTETTAPSLTVVRTLNAPPQEVYKAWTDPALLSRWMSLPGGGAVSWQADPRVGGQYRMETKSPDGQVHVTTGVYRELEPGRRLVQTWVYQGPYAPFMGHETLLTVELRELSPNLTELTLRHEHLPSEDYKSSVTGGWNALLDGLMTFYAEEPVAPSRME